MRRSQAALEFLTTYGWAFLIILIMIGALSYFGVFNPGDVLPQRCLFSSEVQCTESIIDGGANNNVVFVMRNNVGTTATFTFTASYIGTSTTPMSGACTFNPVNPINHGRTTTVTCAFAPATYDLKTGDKAKILIEGTYQKEGGSLAVPISGEIYGEVK